LYKIIRLSKSLSGRCCKTMGFISSGPALLSGPNRLNASISFGYKTEIFMLEVNHLELCLLT
jgi:hypothetical protein